MSTGNFLIESSDIELAQNICKLISDTGVRNRAVANALAAGIAVRYFEDDKYKAEAESGLHNIGRVLEDIDISDLYVNNCYIDARVFFSDDELSVPAAHFNDNLLPLAYMFIKITPDLSGAEVVGFIKPEDINKNNLIDGYYHITEDDLKSFYEVENLLSEYSDEPDIEDKDIFAYIDGKLDDVNEFYQKMIHSKDARLRLEKALKAKEVFRFVSVTNVENVSQSDLDNFDLDEDNSGLDSLEGFGFDTANGDDLVEDAQTGELALNSEFELNADLNNDDLLELSSDGDLTDNVLEQNEEEQNVNIADSSVSKDDLVPEFQNDLAELVDEEKEDNNVVNDNDVVVEDKEDENSFGSFTTVASPSLDNLEDILNEESEKVDSTPELSTEKEQREESHSEEQIEALFNNGANGDMNADAEEMDVYPQAKQKTSLLKPLAIVAVLAILGAGSYLGYTKFSNNSLPENDIIANNEDTTQSVAEPVQSVVEPIQSVQQEAMPNEKLDIVPAVQSQNEGTSTSIPAIEQNLDASILVTNLKVDWEVPAGYAANTSAKRYLIKLGKIIQLNLKTELLLLNKPPISNKIAVEIRYNPSSRKFEAMGVTVSSGEQSVDNVIMQTVNKALAMNLSMNTDSFAKLQGNPVLIIHL